MALNRSPDRENSTPASSPVFPQPGWYDHGMTNVAKITVSLPRELVGQVRDAVASGEAASVSGYVSAALADALATRRSDGSKKDGSGQDGLAELIEELIAEYGEPSAEAYAWADAALALSDPH
jgi:Arc/MetJ-type ribon-helix-helix transcriptional regulator